MSIYWTIKIAVSVDHEPTDFEVDGVAAVVDPMIREFMTDLTSTLPDGWTAEEA